MKKIDLRDKKVIAVILVVIACIILAGTGIALRQVGKSKSTGAETVNQQIDRSEMESSLSVENTTQEEEKTETEEDTENNTEETSEETSQEPETESIEITEIVQEDTEAVTEASVQEEPLDFVTYMDAAAYTSQLIVVSSYGSSATVTMHQKDGNGVWSQVMSTSGYVGMNGVGQALEGFYYSPAGTYTLSRAFGVSANPGCTIGYTQVNDSHYWVDDPNSAYYNQFVSTSQIPASNWTSAEHLIDYPTQYAYAVAIDYNTSCTPGAGSAFFLHCSNGGATAGCVAIPRGDMIYVLTHLQSDCRIVIQ